MCPDLDSPRKRTNNQFPAKPSPRCGLDPQLLSLYIDEELPSPWKEKLEAHLERCSKCKEKLESYKKLQGKLFNPVSEQDLAAKAREKVWQNLQTARPDGQMKPSHAANTGLWRRRSFWQQKLTIPIPAAAAAVIIAVLAMLFAFTASSGNKNNLTNHFADTDRANIILAAEEIPVFPAVDLNSVFQYLISESTEIIILQLPESRSFHRTGDPAIIRAADYRRTP